MLCRFLLFAPGDREPLVLSYDQSPNFSALAPDDFRTRKERLLSPIRNILTLQKSPSLWCTTQESRSKQETRESLFMYMWYTKILFPKRFVSQCDTQEISSIKMIKVCSNKFLCYRIFFNYLSFAEISVYKSSTFNLLFVEREALFRLRKKLVKS